MLIGKDREEMTVDKFFETFLFTKAVLLLMKPSLQQRSMIKMQKDSTVIRQEKNVKERIRKFYLFRR